MDRVELHFHLLPDVDDGPHDLGVALALARDAVRDGTGLVTCTPHASFVDVAEIPERVRELQAGLVQAGLDPDGPPRAELARGDGAPPGAPGPAAAAPGPPRPRRLPLRA